MRKVVKYHAFSQICSAKKIFLFIVGKRYTLRMPGILILRNGFIDWLDGYYLCAFMLRTCTDKMAYPILLRIFAGNFAVFILKPDFILFEKKYTKWSILVQRRAGKCMTTVFFPASIWGPIIGTSSPFVKKHIGLCFTNGNIWPS